FVARMIAARVKLTAARSFAHEKACGPGIGCHGHVSVLPLGGPEKIALQNHQGEVNMPDRSTACKLLPCTGVPVEKSAFGPPRQ
ncbi:MAG: hypothetical protein P8182_16100, partial [Deltaproteobacteria bacterium]